MPDTELAKRTNPLLGILRVFNRTISYYHVFTITALIILDVLFTAPEAALVGISSLTFGLVAAPSIAMWGFADIGLMFIGFILTMFFELLMGKKPVGTAFSLGIISALFLAFPGPVFTLSVITGKALGWAFPEKEKPEELERPGKGKPGEIEAPEGEKQEEPERAEKEKPEGEKEGELEAPEIPKKKK